MVRYSSENSLGQFEWKTEVLELRTAYTALITYFLNRYFMWILSRVLVTNNAGSGLVEGVYLSSYTPPVIKRNYSAIVISTLYDSL
jgi:hypothetical protein